MAAALSPVGRRARGLTVFIPSWNHARYLPRAIRSALAAADRLEARGVEAEVIVADDASRDGTARLLRSIEMYRGDSRLQTLFLRERRGLARLRNLGLAMARYRWVLLLDADNEVVPENVPLFVAAMEATGAALVYGNLLERSEGCTVGLRSGETASWALTVANSIDAFALVDADAVLRLGGYVEVGSCEGWEDWEMLLHLMAEEALLVFVPAVLGYYHEVPRSMSRMNQPHLATAGRLLQRIYAQSGPREWDRRRVGRMYHPDVGWMDEP